jgi:hypothetical protein
LMYWIRSRCWAEFGTAIEIMEATEGNMTTEALNFPVFHSDQGVESDTVQFSREDRIADVTKAKDLDLAKPRQAATCPASRRSTDGITGVCIRSV